MSDGEAHVLLSPRGRKLHMDQPLARPRFAPSLCNLRAVVGACSLIAPLLFAESSSADTVLGANLALTKPLGASDTSGGWGFDGRFGSRLNGGILVFTGEVDGGYQTFGGAFSPT